MIFLDIQLPKITGIDFLKTLDDPPIVIIISAYSEHAIEAFELVAFDYLLKPYAFTRLLKAIQRVNQRLLEQGTKAHPVGENTDYLYVTVDRNRIRLAELIFIESDKEYNVITSTSEEIRVKQSLSATLKQLPPQFIRIHRSYIVNLDHVKAFSGTMVELETGELPLGDHFRDPALAVLRAKFR